MTTPETSTSTKTEAVEKKPAAAKAAPAKKPAVPAAEKKPATPAEKPSVDEKLSDDIISDALTRVGQHAEPAEPEESTGVAIPPTMDVLENVPNTINGTAIEVRLYGEGCLECSHLIPSAEEAQNKCHFSNGNQFCPAGFHRIVFVGTRMRYVQRINKYRASGESNRMLKVLNELEAEDLETKNFVLKEVGLLAK